MGLLEGLFGGLFEGWLGKLPVLALCCGMASVAPVQAADYWKPINTLAARSDLPLMAKARGGAYLWGDTARLRQQLLSVDSMDIALPLPSGEQVIYALEYSPIAEQGLVDEFPEIRTFRGTDIDNPGNTGRFDISPLGFRGMFRHNGDTVYIDPQYVGSSDAYIVYSAAQAESIVPRPGEELLPSAVETLISTRGSNPIAAKGSSDGNNRTYRLAVAATGEYTAFFGGTVGNGMAAITTAINRVNQVFQNDLGITLQLVAGNSAIVYTNSATDPYDNNSSSDLSTNDTNLDAVIGSANYDVGHLFTTGSGGVAQLSSVCTGFKGRGLSGLSSPTGDAFYIDFVAHELGHQFGANHTFNGTASSCVSPNRNASTAYEPGSGSTIMAYAGICGGENLQANSDPYFHAGSIAEITTFVQSGNGAACGTVSAQVNNVPDVDAGSDFTIPAATAFILSGSATDGDFDGLTYTWEQMDVGEASSSEATQVDNGNRAIFRSFSPSSSALRYLPQLSDIVDGDSITIGETYPTSNRSLNFRLTARDNNRATGFDDMVVTVVTSAGPFIVTAPALGASWTTGETHTVTWDVANTDSAPVNCAQVDILLSTDGGATFPTSLAAASNNDGSQDIFVPAGVAGTVRVMVRCSNQRFFAISGARPDVDIISSGASSGGSSGGGGSLGAWVMAMLLSLAVFHGRDPL